MVSGHPCYTPGKDLVVPAFRAPQQYRHSPYFGGEIRQRDILLLLVGDLGDKKPGEFSRGLRQDILQYATAEEWRKKYGAWVGTPEDLKAEPSALYARAQYCLIAIEDGWSAVFEEAVLHGCVPVVVEEDIHLALGGALRHKQVMVRIPHELLPQLPLHLQQITAEELQVMRWRIDRGWWRRMAWLSHPAVSVQVQEVVHENEKKFPEQKLKQQQAGWWRTQSSAPAAAAAGGGLLGGGGDGGGGQQHQQQPPQQGALGGLPPVWHPRQPEDDAFGTLMQWLYHKLQQRVEAATPVEADMDGKPGSGMRGARGDGTDGPEATGIGARGDDKGDGHKSSGAGGGRRLSKVFSEEIDVYGDMDEVGTEWELASELGFESDVEIMEGKQLDMARSQRMNSSQEGQQERGGAQQQQEQAAKQQQEQQRGSVGQHHQQQQREPGRWREAEPPLPVRSRTMK